MMKRVAFDEVRNNNWRSVFLVFLFFILIAAIGLVIGFFFGDLYVGVILTVIIGIIYTLIVFASGDSILLTSTGAKEVTKKEFPHLYHTVEGLAIAAGIPAPKCYVIDDPSPNAYATGKNYKKGAIVVTTGLMNKLNRQELEGVVAHEMSHIKNHDIRVMMIAAVLVGVISLLSHILIRSMIFGGGNRNRSSGGGGQAGVILLVAGLVLAILSPFIAQLIRLGVSRKREYMADADAVNLTRYPAGLAGALKKIAGDKSPSLKGASTSNAHVFISSPLRGGFSGLFSTHPPIQERIKRLEQM